MGRRLWWVEAALAAVGFAAFAVFSEGGLVTTSRWGDVGRYETIGRRVLSGEIPYADFTLEYPPFALIPFTLPALITETEPGYLQTFKLLMAILGILTVVITCWPLRQLRVERRMLALATLALTPLLLGHVTLNRYDLWPAFLIALSVAAFLAGRDRLGGAALAGSFMAKVFAGVAAPVVAIWLWRRGGHVPLARGAAAFLAVCVVVAAPFLATGPGGLGFSYWMQAARGLHGESLAGSLLLAADTVGLFDARLAPLSPGSLDLEGALPEIAASVMTVLLLAAFAWDWRTAFRASATAEALVVAVAFSVTAVVALAKIVSPQYLVWLVPLVPLVGGRRGRIATATLAGAMVLTQIQQYAWEGFHVEPWGAWLLVARNAAILAMLVLFAKALRDLPRRAAGRR